MLKQHVRAVDRIRAFMRKNKLALRRYRNPPAYRPALEEKIRFGKRFAALPERLKERWWKWTYYGKHPPTNELMWTIEAIDEELADYLSKLSPLGRTQ
jgi:hypothetical protein